FVHRAGRDVVAPHLEIGVVEPLDETGVEVDRQHLTGRPDALAQPRGHGPAAGADLEAAPALRDPDLVEDLRGERVEQRLTCSHPLALALPRKIERVLSHQVPPWTDVGTIAGTCWARPCRIAAVSRACPRMFTWIMSSLMI